MYVRIYYIKSPFVAGAILFLQNAPKKKHTKDSHHIIIAQNAKKKKIILCNDDAFDICIHACAKNK